MQIELKRHWFWNRIDDWFLAKNVKSNRYDWYRGRVLAIVHLFLILVIGISLSLTTLVTPENKLGIAIPTLVVVFLPILFKLFGNLHFSGNVLAIGFAVILVPMVLETGGLFSDNLLWLIMCPLVVMLFSSKNSVIAWMLALESFIFYLAKQPDLFLLAKVPIAELHTTKYYTISLTLLVLVIVLVVYLFKLGEERIITDLQNNKAALERKSKDLLHANKQLQLISQQLRTSNKDLESFAYAASHDLKEPLRMIGSYTHLLERRLDAQLTNDQKEMMGFVRSGVERMQKLLDDILNYSKVGRARDHKAPIDLCDVLYFVQSNLRLRIEETQAEITLPESMPLVWTRYSEMVQLFQNLIGNALKFKKPDVTPKISLTWTLLPKDMILIQLSDNGIGIAEEYKERVFNLFERLNNRRDYEGSGIGLSTSKKIVVTNGGKIHLTSQEGVGTTFFIELPLNEEAFELSITTNPNREIEDDASFIPYQNAAN